MTLKELKAGKTAKILTVGGEGALRQHFLDMGLIPEAEVTMVKLAPMGDPMELKVHGYELTLRLADADKIQIVPVDRATEEAAAEPVRGTPHPGLGEGGKYHVKAGRILCRRGRRSPSRLREIRTAAKRQCSTV